MTVTPTGTPPRHTHLDTAERFPRSGYQWEWRHVGGDVPIPEGARVDVRNEDGSCAERSQEWTPEDRDPDDEKDEGEASPHRGDST